MPKLNSLVKGKYLTGVIVDGIEGTPATVATLSYDAEGGVIVEVPFLDHGDDAQFSAAKSWFRGQEKPPNLEILTGSGTYTLIGCRYSQAVNHESSGIMIGRIRPELSVSSSRAGKLDSPLKLSVVRSQLDGLKEITNATSFEAIHDQHADTGRSQIMISFPESETVTWKQDAAHLMVGPDPTWESGHRNFQIQDQIFLTSTFLEPATFDEHLAEQAKIAQLLSVLHGAPSYFRQHDIKDNQFPEKFINGKTAYIPFQNAVSRKTYREIHQPEPGEYLYKYSLASLKDIGQAGLEAWASTHDSWKRVIEPLSELFRRRTTWEDALVSTCIALEAAGHLLGPIIGEAETYNSRNKPTTATYLFRCLSQIPAEWNQIAETVSGFSRVAAGMYNDIKHFERQSVPDPTHLMLTTQVLILVTRMVVLAQIDERGQFITKAATGSAMRNALTAFKERALFVSDMDGFIQRTEQLGEQP